MDLTAVPKLTAQVGDALDRIATLGLMPALADLLARYKN